jgi:type IV secretion system protein VirD4
MKGEKMLLETATGIGIALIGYYALKDDKQELGTSKLGKTLGIYEAKKGKNGIMVSKKHCICTQKIWESILAIAPPGEGKTSSLIINNLLSKRIPKANKIIFDPKGEIYDTTHAYLESIGEECVIFEPLGGNAKYNPLDFCEEFTDYRDLAYTILSNAAKGHKDDTWTIMSLPLFTAALLYAGKLGKPYNTISFALDTLIKCDDNKLLSLFRQTNDEQIAEQFLLYLKSKESSDTSGSIQANLAMNTALFTDPKIKISTSDSTFDFKSLRDKSKKINIFVKYDIDKSTYLSSLLAVFFSQMVHQLIKDYKQGESKKIIIFGDELQNLGKIPNLKEYIAYMRYSEIAMVACIQTVSAMYDLYGKYAGDSIIGCFKTIVMFPSNKDPAALDMFSRLSGEQEITVQQDLRSQKTKKQLFTGDELRRLPSYHVLIICGNQKYCVDKADY